jgi:hypothetical protein
MTFCLQLIQLRPETGQITDTGKTFEDLQNLRITEKSPPVTSGIFLIRPGQIASMGDILRRELIKINRVLMKAGWTITTNRHKLRHFRFANAIGIFSLPGFRPFVCGGRCQHKTGTRARVETLLGHVANVHWFAIAAATPGKVRDRSFHLSGLGGIFQTRPSLPSTMLLGVRHGRFLSQRHVAFISP